jgi:hypothetical protein
MPVRDAKAEHVAIELHRLLNIVDAISDVAQFDRHDAGLPSVILGKRIVGKNVNQRALGIAEHDRLGDTGRHPARPLAGDAMLCESARDLRQIASGGDLKR